MRLRQGKARRIATAGTKNIYLSLSFSLRNVSLLVEGIPVSVDALSGSSSGGDGGSW